MCLLLHRLLKAIEHLQCFSLAADPSFRHYSLDATKEVKLINSLKFIQGKGQQRCVKNNLKKKKFFFEFYLSNQGTGDQSCNDNF